MISGDYVPMLGAFIGMRIEITGANAGALTAGTRNLCFYDGDLEVIPDQERYSVTANASQELAQQVMRAGGQRSSRPLTDSAVPSSRWPPGRSAK